MKLLSVFGLCFVAICSSAACASTGPSVRALRMYEREQASPAQLQAHVQELADTLSLINQLMQATPYQPGEPWVRRIALDSDAEARARAALGEAGEHASFVRVYSAHVQSVLRNASKAPTPDAVATPTYGSISEALALVHPSFAGDARAVERQLTQALTEANARLTMLQRGGQPAPAAQLPAVDPATLDPASVDPATLDPSAPPADPSTLDPSNMPLDGTPTPPTPATPTPATPTPAPSPAPTPAAVDRAQVSAAEQEVTELQQRLAALQTGLSRTPSKAELNDPLRVRIVEDATAVTSVALRMALEATSLMTVIGLQAAELARQPADRWLEQAPEAVQVGSELPQDVQRLFGELNATKDRLGELLAQLSKLDGVDPLSTLGYDYEAGLVDDLVGLGWDSIHVEVQGAGEVLFYNALGSTEPSSDSSGNTYDYTGRLTELTYDVEPIVLASAGLSLTFDWAHWAEAMGLDLSYATNRIYKSGGDISDSSLARELGVSNAWSDALDAAMAVAGVKAKARIAHFNHGTVSQTLIADGSQLAQAPFAFDMKQIDIGYDLAPAHGKLLQSATLGFRYFDYTLPRILYELENSTPGAETAAYVYSRESPAQAVRTQHYMITATIEAYNPLSQHFDIYLMVDLAAGYGPTRYYFLINDADLDEETNREHHDSSGISVGIAGALGGRYRFGKPSDSLRVFMDAHYQAQSLLPITDSDSEGDTRVDYGTTDLFHGLVAAFGATF